MSLKHDIEKHPWAFSKELLEAVEDYKSGKRNSKRRLRKIVNRDRLSDHFYKETIERYSDVYLKNKKNNKRQYFNRTNIFKVLYFAIIIVAIIIIDNCIIVTNEWAWYAFLVVCFCVWIYHKEKLDDCRNLYIKVASIFNEQPYNNSLIDIEIIQNNEDLQELYRIDFSNESEIEDYKKILGAHKKHILEDYFSGRLLASKDIYNLNVSEYYFFSLNSFIGNKLSAYSDEGMYSSKEYVSEYKFKCQLTNYGKAYYKLYLITNSYLQNNKNIQKLYKYVDNEKGKHIMECLDKNEVHFLEYRP